MNNILSKLFKKCAICHDIGILILRVAVGYLMVSNHGWDKLTGGPERWTGIGEYGMQHLGIASFYVFWGFMAAFSESICAILIAVGLGTRFAAGLLTIGMLVAANTHIATGKGSPESALLYASASLAILFMGSGKFSLDHLFCTAKK